MFALDRILDLLDRLGSYSKPAVALELMVIWLMVFVVVRFVQGTRAAGALKGTLAVIVLATVLARLLGGAAALPRLSYLFERFLALVAVGLVVIFQPELRRALIRIGEAPFFRSTPTEIARVIDAIGEATAYLAKSKMGAIIAVERQVGLKGFTEGGTILDAAVTAPLLQTIFFPGSALHDLAVVIRGGLVHAAGVQLPLADPADMPDPRLGSRHRAAVGLSKESDALVVVVSEETGHIRLADRGRLSLPLSPDELRQELSRRLVRPAHRKGGQVAPEAEPAVESISQNAGIELGRRAGA